MNQLETYFFISLLIQIVHSVEELSTGFHRKWYLFKMSFYTFLVFEILFTLFWILVGTVHNFPYRELFEGFFLALMFANGVQHLVWAGVVKKYVPGLITAPIHILVFLVFYLQMV